MHNDSGEGNSALNDRPRTLKALGATLSIHVTSEETRGSFSTIEFSVPANFAGAPLHFHEQMPEYFHILAGTLEIYVGEDWRSVTAGEKVLIHPKTVHGYRNTSDEPASFLVVAPGHDRFFFDLMEWMSVEPVWPPADRKGLLDFGRRHDTIYV